jgi:hypothetical protein
MATATESAPWELISDRSPYDRIRHLLKIFLDESEKAPLIVG